MSTVINETPVILVLISFAVLWLTFHVIEHHLFMQDFMSPFLPLFIFALVVPTILLIARVPTELCNRKSLGSRSMFL